MGQHRPRAWGLPLVSCPLSVLQGGGRGAPRHTHPQQPLCVSGRDALEGKGPQRRPRKQSDRLWEEVAEVVGGSLWVTNAIEAGTCRPGDKWLGVGWA